MVPDKNKAKRLFVCQPYYKDNSSLSPSSSPLLQRKNRSSEEMRKHGSSD